jgi:hypothetical protein
LFFVLELASFSRIVKAHPSDFDHHIIAAGEAVDEDSNPPINILRPIAMAYNGFNGYADDHMDIETSGPKVVVREVRPP